MRLKTHWWILPKTTALTLTQPPTLTARSLSYSVPWLRFLTPHRQIFSMTRISRTMTMRKTIRFAIQIEVDDPDSTTDPPAKIEISVLEALTTITTNW